MPNKLDLDREEALREWASDEHTPPTEYRRDMRAVFGEVDELRARAARSRAATPAYRRLRGGVATAEDMREIEALEAEIEAARKPQPEVRSLWDLPIAERMWRGDARDRER